MLRWAAGALVAVAVVIGLAELLDSGSHAVHARHVRRAAPSRRRVATVVHLGASARGRAIDAVHVGGGGRADLLVVGCVHGNEPAGIAVTRRLRRTLLKGSANAWLIDDLNPDGHAAGTRVNGRGVDLNRNFPWRWRHLFRRGELQYGGSPPSTRAGKRAGLRGVPRGGPRRSV